MSFFHQVSDTASSAPVKSTFNVIKNVIFQSHELPTRADKFQVRYFAQIEGQLKLAAASQNRLQSEEIEKVVEQSANPSHLQSSCEQIDDINEAVEPPANPSHPNSTCEEQNDEIYKEVEPSANTSHTQSTCKEDACPECLKGNFPGGAHLCVKCRAPVHIIYESCSKAVNNDDEEYGQKRICVECFNRNSLEDISRENWRGQGYSPFG